MSFFFFFFFSNSLFVPFRLNLGRISNVPPNMLLDQFGMVGLLAYLRAADREKDFFALALGTDLTALGLNLNSAE